MLNKELMQEMRYWVKERDAILALKEGGAPKPWTQDPILQQYRFCNVRREDDKVTRWFAANWRHDAYWQERNFVPAIILGRTINWPDTLTELGFPHTFNKHEMVARLDARQARGDKVYTGAYMVTAGPTGVKKNTFVLNNAETYFFSPPKLDLDSLENSWNELQSYPCVGRFIAGQIIADLKNSFPLRQAKDWWTWAALGPGSTRGLNRLYDRRLEVSIPQDQGLAEMREVASFLTEHELHLQDVQNCLCEFDKYMRVKLGQGKPRSGYPGR